MLVVDKGAEGFFYKIRNLSRDIQEMAAIVQNEGAEITDEEFERWFVDMTEAEKKLRNLKFDICRKLTIKEDSDEVKERRGL